MQALIYKHVDNFLFLTQKQYVGKRIFSIIHYTFFYLYKNNFFVYNTIYVVTDGEKL